MMNAPIDLDPEALQRLQRLGGGKFTAEMIRLFVNYGGEKLAEARNALQAGDLTAVEKAVHPIKSSAGNVGAVRMQHLATQAEQQAKEGKAEAVATLVNELEVAFQTVRTVLEAEKDKLPSAEKGAQ